MIFKIKFYISKLISTIDFLIPKDKKKIIFISYPDFADNTFALFVYFIKKRNNYSYIWLVEDLKNIKIYNKLKENYLYDDNFKCSIIEKKSLKGLFYYFRSKYIFFTHGGYPGMMIPSNHIVVNLWHGIALKNIGYLDNKSYFDIVQSKYIVSTSKTYQNILSKCFGKPIEEILIAGQPRNDFLFSEFERVDNIIRKNLLKYNKNIIWLPTYRKSTVGDIREDGDYENILPLIPKNKLSYFNEQLQILDIHCIVKLHPMESENLNDVGELTNITIITNDYLDELGINLYSLVKYMDLLLTDYSSIYIDFMLLDRPIGFVIPDIDKYQKNRGFLLENFSETMLPGEKIKDFDVLINFLKQTMYHYDDRFKTERKELMYLYNYNYNKSYAEILLEKIKII